MTRRSYTRLFAAAVALGGAGALSPHAAALNTAADGLLLAGEAIASRGEAPQTDVAATQPAAHSSNSAPGPEQGASQQQGAAQQQAAAALPGASNQLNEFARGTLSQEQALQRDVLELEALHRSLLVRGRAYVRLVRLGLLPVGGGLEALVSHANQVELLKSALERDVARQHLLTQHLQRLQQQLREAAEQQGKLKNELSNAERSHEAILAAQERESAFQRAFGGALANDGHSTVYGSIANTVTAAATFSELKGRLPIPVEGRAEVREVEADDARGPGVELRVDLGGVARAVYPGKVVLVGDYGGMGTAILIEHDSGYSTLYGSLAKARVEVGQQVSNGAVIGELARVKGGARLYLEVRHDGERLYPSDWLGIHAAH